MLPGCIFMHAVKLGHINFNGRGLIRRKYSRANFKTAEPADVEAALEVSLLRL